MPLHVLNRFDGGIGPNDHHGVIKGGPVRFLRHHDRLDALAVKPCAREPGRTKARDFKLAGGDPLHDTRIVGGREQLHRHTKMLAQQFLELIVTGQTVLRILATKDSDAKFLQSLGTGPGHTETQSAHSQRGGAHHQGLSAKHAAISLISCFGSSPRSMTNGCQIDEHGMSCQPAAITLAPRPSLR